MLREGTCNFRIGSSARSDSQESREKPDSQIRVQTWVCFGLCKTIGCSYTSQARRQAGRGEENVWRWQRNAFGLFELVQLLQCKFKVPRRCLHQPGRWRCTDREYNAFRSVQRQMEKRSHPHEACCDDHGCLHGLRAKELSRQSLSVQCCSAAMSVYGIVQCSTSLRLSSHPTPHSFFISYHLRANLAFYLT